MLSLVQMAPEVNRKPPNLLGFSSFILCDMMAASVTVAWICVPNACC